MTTRVDILIVNYNTCEDLAACLASLHATPAASLARIIVVDNASSDGSVERVRHDWPDVEVIALEANGGFAAGNNAGLRVATAPLVMLLNSDTIVPAGAIDTLVSRLEAAGAVAAGPRLVGGDGRPEVSFGPMLSPLGELRQSITMKLAASEKATPQRFIERLLSREREVDWVTGACLLVRRAEALEAGLLDERYFMYEEDVDFCAALRARGGRILFTPQATVVHLRGRSIGKSGGRASGHYDRSHLAFYRKHLPRWAPLLALWMRARGRSVR